MSSLKVWLQLFRVPNLFTVPGDPLAGFLLASWGLLDGRAGWAILASLSFYMAGMLMNDLCDLAEDRSERPNRPLPSGRANPNTVFVVTIILLVFGLGILVVVAGKLGALVGAVLAGAIYLYNGWTKRLPVIGALNMGLCRGLSVLAGAVVAIAPHYPIHTPALVIAGITTLYFAAVTNLARHETKERVPHLAKVLPSSAAFLGLAYMIYGTGPVMQALPSTTYAIGCVFVVATTLRLLRKPAQPVPPVIGAMIRTHLFFQAGCCLAFYLLPASDPVLLSGIGLLLCYPLSKTVSRRFYAS